MQVFPRRLRILVLVVSLSFSVPGTIWAQDDDSHAPDPGSWALQFAVNSNFDVASFTGSALSVKRQLSSHRALRIGISLDGSFESVDRESGSSTSSEADRQSYTVQGAYLFYLRGGNDIHAYAGPGAFVWTGSEESHHVSGDRRREREQDMVGGGLMGVLGVEWFVRSNLSLTAEYGVDVAYSRDTRDVEDEGDGRTLREVTTDRFSFGGRGVTVGVSVYF